MSCKRNRAGPAGGGDRGLAAKAAVQKGVVSVDQMRDLGVSSRAAAHRAEVGRLHRLHRGVYAVGHEALDERGRVLAAVLACGDGSVISHLSAAALWGMRDRSPLPIDVIVPCQTGRKIDGIRPHRCRAPRPDELTTCDGVPCTTPSRTLVDLAGMLGLAGLRSAVEQAAVLRILDIAAVDRAIDRGRGRRGVPQLRVIVDNWRGEDASVPRLRSVLEAKLLSLVMAHGLPRPVCNQKLRVGGREIEVDFFWPDRRLVVEADGYAFHGTRAAFERDPRRDQALLLAGYRVARFTWDQVEREPEATVSTIARFLEGKTSGVVVEQERDELPPGRIPGGSSSE